MTTVTVSDRRWDCRDAAHGIDEREVEPMKTRRSVGAEVNWGIRFTCQGDADTFLDGLAGARSPIA